MILYHKCTSAHSPICWRCFTENEERKVMKEMLKERIAEIEILEGHPDDEQLSGYITFGLFVKVGEETIIIEDITDDLAALKSFAKKLKAADFDLTSLKYLVDDFLSDRYGL